MLGSAERGKVRLISREIIFQEFMIMITDRRTDKQLSLAIPRSAYHRAVKTILG